MPPLMTLTHGIEVSEIMILARGLRNDHCTLGIQDSIDLLVYTMR